MYWTDARVRAEGLRPVGLRVPLPEGPQDVAGILDAHVRERPNALALVGRHERLTFSELNAQVDAATGFLASLGVRQGDRVAASATNGTELVVAFLAVQRLGAVWVGINRKYAPPEKRFLLEDAEARVFLADEQGVRDIQQLASPPAGLRHVVSMEPGSDMSEWRKGLRRFAGKSAPRAPVDPWAPAAIAYTSGTTGYPKGVVHSQHSIVLAAWVAAVNSGRTDPDVVRATALPMTILNLMIHGPVCAFATGARHVCMDRIDAQGVAEWVEKERVNTLSLVPTVVRDLLTLPEIRPQALATISWLLTGAAVVPSDLPRLYEQRFGRKLSIGYGLTECPTGVSMTRDDSPGTPGSIGRPHFHLQVTIRDEAGNELPREEDGEICFRAVTEGPWAHVYSGPLGYWRKPEATETLWRGDWVHSSDIGYMDAAGNLFIRDRRSDLIIRGGANVYPAEVERVLRLDPRVRDCAVVGLPDPRLGQIVAAFVEPCSADGAGTLVDDLKALCRREIAEYKIPVRWTIVESMPRNAMGKIVKAQLVASLVDV